MAVLDESQSRTHVLERFCGFSTPVRSGTCFAELSELQTQCIGAFQTWCSNEALRRVLTDVADELRDKRRVGRRRELSRRNLRDGRGRGCGNRPDQAWKRHEIRGDRGWSGLPLSVTPMRQIIMRCALVQLCFDFYMIEAKPESLIGDRAYDSDPLDNDLR